MLGLTREKVPGLVTALYVSLVLYSLLHTFKGAGDAAWGLVVILLTFPWSLLLAAFWYLLPAAGGLWVAVPLVAAFAAANAYLIRRACRGIVGAG